MTQRDSVFLLHANSLSDRGDSVSLLEMGLGLRAHGIPVAASYFRENVENSVVRIQEFEANGIRTYPYRDRTELEAIAERIQATHFLVFSDGTTGGSQYWSGEGNDYRIGSTVHITWVVFNNFQPHGDYYLYVSRWLWKQNLLRASVFNAKRFFVRKGTLCGCLEHFLEVEKGDRLSFRAALKIPERARVGGRIGGRSEFSDPVAQQGVLNLLNQEPNFWFVAVSTEFFGAHDRLIYVDRLSRNEVWDFYAACDFLVNGRLMGESFGLGIVEALKSGKPIMAPAAKRNRKMDRNHLQLLRRSGLLYSDESDFNRIIRHLFEADSSAVQNRRGNLKTREQGVRDLLRKIKLP